MPPLFRVDVGKQVFYCLDESEKQAMLARIEREKMKGAVSTTRFKGLGEMNPPQLRESTIHPDTRRLVQLTIDEDIADTSTIKLMDMLLSKKRAGDRKTWLEQKGDLATLEAACAAEPATLDRRAPPPAQATGRQQMHRRRRLHHHDRRRPQRAHRLPL